MGKRMVTILLLALVGGIAGFAGLMAAEATAARYTVSQCGWHVGMDAGWADTSAGKFSRSSYCQTPASADPFENVHMVSQTRTAADTVGGGRYARWRWTAPGGTGIVTIEGQRWHHLNDGFQHRIGGVSSAGAFAPFAQYSATDSVKRDFHASFSPFANAVETRLLCAKADDRVCSTDPNSVAGVRGLRLTLDDSHKPDTHYTGALAGDGWLRGGQSLQFAAGDYGSGLRYSQTTVDDVVRATSEHPCDKMVIAGQWHATRMRPCSDGASGTHVVQTTTLSDGPHRLRHCAIDFAGNVRCTPDDVIRVDNTSPAAPQQLAVAGGSEWRRQNGFRLDWQEPHQGAGAPLGVFGYRLKGPGMEPKEVWSYGRRSLDGVEVPGPGEYEISVWLVDGALNVNQAANAKATLRFDDVAPRAHFIDPPKTRPDILITRLADEHSGVAGGGIRFRRQGTGGEWQRLDTELGADGKGPLLRATFPRKNLTPGIYEFEASATDKAGNAVVTRLRADDSPMTIEIPVPVPDPPPPPAPQKDPVTLTARFARGAERSVSLVVPHGDSALVEGRLTGPGGNGLAGQTVSVLQRPVPGAETDQAPLGATTDSDGFFTRVVPAGASRNVFVRFDGTARLKETAVGPLEMRVGGSVMFRAKPRRLATGQKVIFSGAVDLRWVARPAPANVVAIQYFERSSRRWRPVLVTRTDRYGRFRKGYRFRYLTRRTRIRLRATLLPSARFPYERAASKQRVIVVDGRRRAGR